MYTPADAVSPTRTHLVLVSAPAVVCDVSTTTSDTDTCAPILITLLLTAARLRLHANAQSAEELRADAEEDERAPEAVEEADDVSGAAALLSASMADDWCASNNTAGAGKDPFDTVGETGDDGLMGDAGGDHGASGGLLGSWEQFGLHPDTLHPHGLPPTAPSLNRAMVWPSWWVRGH